MLRALIVEDNPAQLMLYDYTLREAQFQIDSAKNGNEAIDYLKMNDVPDLIVLDLKMPESSGFDVLEYLRTYPHLEAVHVVIATATVSDECVPYLETFPYIDYLLKPLVLPDLKKIAANIKKKC